MSNRFAIVKIGTLYLTHNGLVGGDPLRCQVKGEARFSGTIGSNHVVAADSTVHVQNINRGVKGLEFDVVLEYCLESILTSLVTILNAALTGDTTVRVIVESLVDFDVLAYVLPQDGQLFTFDERSGGQARNVTVKFVAAAPGA